MKSVNKFFYIEKYGQLEIDRILFEASYPILFTCKNDKDDLFICVCCKNNETGKKWLITQTAPESIIRMLTDKMTIREVFLANMECRLSIESSNNILDIKYNDVEDWSDESIYLPKAGEYIDAEPGEFDDDIKYYMIQLEKDYSDKIYSKILDAIEPLKCVATPLKELDITLTCLGLNYEKMQSEILHTLVSTESFKFHPFTRYLKYLSGLYNVIGSVKTILKKSEQDKMYDVVDENNSEFLDAAQLGGVMSAINSSLILQKLVFDKIEFERKGFKNENEVTFEIQVQIGVAEEKDYKVTLTLKGDKTDEYQFVISLSGYFSIDKAELLEDKKIKDLINKNSVAILMPYLRSEVTLLTAQPDTESIVLPPFNIHKLMENAKEQKKA